MTRLFWLEQTDADLPAGDDWLTFDEASRLAGMRFPKRRNDFRLGRWTGKRALSLYLRLPPARIEIRAGPSGAPGAFVDGVPAAVNISLSHSHGTAACAIAPANVRIGCDLERIESRDESFISDYFTSEEQDRIAILPRQDRPELATLIWSAKEAVSKLLGVGLRLDTRSIHVTVGHARGECEGWLPLQCTTDLEGFARQTLHGCWRQRDRLVRTVVASQSPGYLRGSALVLQSSTGT